MTIQGKTIQGRIITLDEELHSYTCRDRWYPGLTQVIRCTDLVDGQWFTDYGAKRGTFAHKALELVDTVGLDRESLDPRLAGYVRSYEQWKERRRIQVEHVELVAGNDQYLYGCRIDRVVNSGGRRVVVEIKTGSPKPGDCYQAAAQAHAVPNIDEAWVLYLNETGTVSTHVTCERDWQVFTWAISLFWERVHRGLLNPERLVQKKEEPA